MMNASAINQTIEIIPLLGYELKKAGGYHVGACPFCGGTDRFTVKHTKDGDRWHCRQCGDGKYHTVIDYIMRRDNADFKTALQTLGGDTLKHIPQAERPKPQPKPITLPSAEWQASALAEITAAADALYQPQGAAARAFLSARSLSVSTWKARLYGAGKAYDFIVNRWRPAIFIPWYEWDKDGEVITAVKYRFIDHDPNPKALRYSCKKGSSFNVPYGLVNALESHHTLLLIEGEFNCDSALQCRPAGVSVLSFGSEGGGDNRVLQSLASRYQNVFVWADDVWNNPKQAQRAKELRALVRGRGKALRSVKQDEVKQDANQLLKVGALPEFLSRVLGVECESM
jgi:hypothetical protein